MVRSVILAMDKVCECKDSYNHNKRRLFSVTRTRAPGGKLGPIKIQLGIVHHVVMLRIHVNRGHFIVHYSGLLNGRLLSLHLRLRGLLKLLSILLLLLRIVALLGSVALLVLLLLLVASAVLWLAVASLLAVHGEEGNTSSLASGGN